MAPIPASIDLNWISNYPAGCHRVCYSEGEPLGPFTCVIVNCDPGVAQPCSTSIPIMVDNETCEPVTYYGYIQACCEDIASTNGRIPWQVTFVPNPSCASVNFLCNDVEVLSVGITNAGSGYNPGVPPLVSIVGGGGGGATATAVVGNGGIKTFTLSNAGAGLTNGFYPAIAAGTVTGAGAGATFNITVAGGVIVTAVRVARGTGYLAGDTINFPTIVGSATELITINTVNTSEIESITVTAPGSGYSSVPSALIAPSPGFGGFPAVNAVLGPVTVTLCPGFNPDAVCGNADPGLTTDVTVGQNFDFCYLGGLSGVPGTIPANYQLSESGLCCYDCMTVRISQPLGGGDALVFYQDCTTNEIVQVGVSADTFTDVCAKRHSYGSDSANTTFTELTSCP